MAKDQTLKIIDMQSFIGGEADNPYMGQANSCAKAVGLDLRSKPGIVQLEKGFEEQEEDVIKKYIEFQNGQILNLYSLQDLSVNYPYYYALVRMGNSTTIETIGYNGIASATFGKGTHHTDQVLLVKGMGYNEGNNSKNFYYYGTEWTGSEYNIPTYRMYIYRGGHNEGAPTAPVEIHTDKNYSVYGTGNMGIFVMNINSKLYIACGNKIFTQDDREVIFDDLVLPAGEIIVGMTEYLGTIKIYSVLGNDTYMYTRDGVDYVASTRQCWKGTKLEMTGCVLNDGAYDYVLSDKGVYGGDLYLVAGTQRQKIKTSNSEIQKDFHRLLCVKDGILYISDMNAKIYTYESRYPGMIKSINASYKLPEGKTAQFMYDEWVCTNNEVYKLGDTLYNEDSGISYRYKNVVQPETLRGGYLETMFYTIDQWKNMAFEMMKLKIDAVYGKILILYRTEIDGTWNLFKEISNNRDGKITISIREFNEDDPGEFTGIQFLFVLQRDGNEGPSIGRCTAFLREIDVNI